MIKEVYNAKKGVIMRCSKPKWVKKMGFNTDWATKTKILGCITRNSGNTTRSIIIWVIKPYYSLSSLLLYRGVDVGIYTKTPLENAKCMFVHFSVSTWTSNGCSFVLTISWCCRSRRRRLVTRYTIKVKRSSEPWIREAAKIANRPSTKNPASDLTLLVELPLIFCQVSKN